MALHRNNQPKTDCSYFRQKQPRLTNYGSAPYWPWYIFVSGLKAATENQKELVWSTRVSFFPAKGPSMASPKILQTLPVSSSTILSPSFLNVCFVPSKFASNSAAAPISLESAILRESKAGRVPGLKKTARSVPPRCS